MDIQDYADGVTAKAVIRFLNKNPDFLAENPSTFDKQDLGLKDGSIVDFQRLQVERLREKVENLEQRQRSLVQAAKSNTVTLSRLERAVLQMISAPRLEDALETITADMAQTMKVDEVVVALEDPLGTLSDTKAKGFYRLTQGSILNLMSDNDIMVVPQAYQEAMVFGGTDDVVQSCILTRIYIEQLGMEGVLAFGSYEPGFFTEDDGTQIVSFLSKAVEGVISGWLAKQNKIAAVQA
jgi:uncharacterized protein